MSEIEQIEVSLNVPQLKVKLVNANETWCLWGRGTGKTTGPLADFMASRAEAMPGHTGGVFGRSFEDLEKKIVPKLMQGLSDQGYYEGQHYVFDRVPPSDFDAPLTPKVTHKRHFHWYTGSVFPLVSLHEKGSANAYDFQSGIFDEVKYMSKKQLDDEIFPTFRGSLRHKRKFGHQSEWLSKIFATDKMMDPLVIQWILDKRKLMDADICTAVISAQIELERMELSMITAKKKERAAIERNIKEVRYYLNETRKTLVYVSEASALENIDVLGDAWLADKERNMSKNEVKVAIKNEDPTQVTEGFYPDLSEEIHEYETAGQEDYVPTLPLIIAPDYQHSVTPIPIAQISQLPWEEHPTLNFIDEVATLAPEGLEDAVDILALKFPRTSVFYLTDHNAINQRQSASAYNEIVMGRLQHHNWDAIEVYTGQAPDHYLKYERGKFYLQNRDGSRLQIRINKKCVHLLQALKNAKTTIQNGKTAKDKRYENVSRFPELDQRHTTHFTDAFDTIWWAVLELGLVHYNATGGGLAFR
jgi:hypothetical protein